MPKVANNALSDDQIAAELTALGCPFTTDQLQKFVSALSVHTHQGTQPREAEIGADGRKVVPEKDGQPLLEDLPYDEAEMARKKKLRGAIERKLNLSYGANKYVAYDGAAPAAAQAAQQVPQAPSQAAPNPTQAAPPQPVPPATPPAAQTAAAAVVPPGK